MSPHRMALTFGWILILSDAAVLESGVRQEPRP